ncbi:uncharacterized protein METZ01_LOCUS458704, partial [marine metagenome]
QLPMLPAAGCRALIPISDGSGRATPCSPPVTYTRPLTSIATRIPAGFTTWLTRTVHRKPLGATGSTASRLAWRLKIPAGSATT